MKRLIFIFLLFISFAQNGVNNAFSANENFLSKDQESRAIKLFKATKCMTCSGESLYESQSAFAVEMRSFIRRQIVSGMTDEQILDILKQRYGSAILGDTPYNAETYFLWITPIFLAVIITVFMALKLGRLKKSAQ
ncbi:Cytochrome c-type biogenesis protein CcmH precursor [Anaplasma phagocytophilum]|uniref:Cytochrome c-type biogenesis protein n=1 Tax=Anaplasma phagocytophilum TaxID=948 RepID=A0AA45US21_ANAPH|nr:cytochrome c-type biogenesis protein CcmH [Anaplasma phagocytophilum]SBO13742.1 Cytochrome c-type biogenesis protein CcmH precursor [Anaplasma phagocytophilum]